MRIFLGLLVVLLSSTALAWDGVITGKISRIDLTGGSHTIRVYMENTPALCGNTNTWAYLKDGADNYDAYVAGLMAAYLADRTVIIYANQSTATANNYCLIGYVSLME